MNQKTKNARILTVAAALALAVSFATVGCDRTISKEETTRVRDDGTVKTKEKEVKQSPDGSVTKEESTTISTNKP